MLEKELQEVIALTSQELEELREKVLELEDEVGEPAARGQRGARAQEPAPPVCSPRPPCDRSLGLSTRCQTPPRARSSRPPTRPPVLPATLHGGAEFWDSPAPGQSTLVETLRRSSNRQTP